MNESNKNEFRILNIINEKYSYNLKGSTIDDFIQGNFSITITRKEFDLLFTEAINKTKEFIKNFPKLDIYKIILLYLERMRQDLDNGNYYTFNEHIKKNRLGAIISKNFENETNNKYIDALLTVSILSRFYNKMEEG
nr:hypothetical protein [uncultured Prevotella sp.]